MKSVGKVNGAEPAADKSKLETAVSCVVDIASVRDTFPVEPADEVSLTLLRTDEAFIRSDWVEAAEMDGASECIPPELTNEGVVIELAEFNDILYARGRLVEERAIRERPDTKE